MIATPEDMKVSTSYAYFWDVDARRFRGDYNSVLKSLSDQVNPGKANREVFLFMYLFIFIPAVKIVS